MNPQLKISLFVLAAGLVSAPTPSSAYPHPRPQPRPMRDCYPAMAGHLAICPGALVMNRHNQGVGTVRSVFHTGEIMVDMSAGSGAYGVQAYRAEQLSVAVQEISGFTAGTQVMSRNNTDNVGNVRHVFEDGMAVVSMTSGAYANTDLAYHIQGIARSVSRFHEFCLNDRVIHRADGAWGTVVTLFDNGMALVRMDSGYHSGTIRTYNVAGLASLPKPVPGPIVVPAPGPRQIMCTATTSRGIAHRGFGQNRSEAELHARQACITVEGNALACNRQSQIRCY